MANMKQIQQDINELPEEAQQILREFVAFLKQRYQPSQHANLEPLNLENESFVGMWSDRREMQDSTAWVRQVRQQHWRT